MQLNATSKLAISCEPREADGASAPCIHENFFHFPRGFESMTADSMAFHAQVRRIDPFNQCRRRKLDADWPTLELDLERTAETRTMRDVMALLRGRVVTLIGASVVRATFGAIQCALETARLRREHELQWRLWGWGTFTADNRGCAEASAAHPGLDAMRRKHDSTTRAFAKRLRAAGCVGSGDRFAFYSRLGRAPPCLSVCCFAGRRFWCGWPVRGG